MSNKTISAKDKISAVLLYFEGNISQHQLAKQLEVSLATVHQWIRNYESMGEDAFLIQHYKQYPKELKLQAVQDYLAGCGSQDDICKKYRIRSKSKLQKWIKQYNGYDGQGNVALAKEKNIRLVITALIGKEAPDALADFEFDENGTRLLKCVAGHEPLSQTYTKTTKQISH